MTDLYDTVVIGGGPAGSTAATLLAERGHRVRLIEKERFPRFHIGESLLPCDLPVFQRLGFEPASDHSLCKLGAEFLDEPGDKHAVYWFADGLEGTPGHAWQVERARFDAALLEGAARKGADVIEGERVLEADIDSEEVTVRSEGGHHRARYLVDATGQDAFLARRQRTVEPIKGFGMAAVFRHYDQLHPAARRELEYSGNIRVLILSDGWAWLIPLPGAKLSFGVVRAQQGMRYELLDEVARDSPCVRRLTEGATPGKPQIVRNFSYANSASHGRRYACIGDAACFLDPVFSSGVSLAMVAAEHMAELLAPALEHGQEAEPTLMDPLSEHMNHAYTTFGTLIHAFYHTRIVDHLFFHDDPDPHIHAGLISILAGDVWRDDNRFQKLLLNSSRRRSFHKGGVAGGRQGHEPI